jgi:hypothetical protein
MGVPGKDPWNFRAPTPGAPGATPSPARRPYTVRRAPGHLDSPLLGESLLSPVDAKVWLGPALRNAAAHAGTRSRRRRSDPRRQSIGPRTWHWRRSQPRRGKRRSRGECAPRSSPRNRQGLRCAKWITSKSAVGRVVIRRPGSQVLAKVRRPPKVNLRDIGRVLLGEPPHRFLQPLA